MYEVNHIGDNLLENFELIFDPLNSELNIELERKVLEKLLTIKTLKEISFEIGYLNSNEIQKIKGKNTSVNNLKISLIIMLMILFIIIYKTYFLI